MDSGISVVGSGVAAAAVRTAQLATFPAFRLPSAKISEISSQQIAKNGTGFFGHKGFELRNASYQRVRNDSAVIQDRQFVGHALDQMQNRGITPSIVEEAIKKYIGIPNKVVGRTQLYDSINNITVITEDEVVVTVIRGKFG